MSHSELVQSIISAIAERNFIELCRLKDICDLLHAGEEELDGFTADDLPDDALYEQMCEVLNEVAHMEGIKADIRETSLKDNNNYFMGSVPKEKSIKVTKNVLLMPKYDGFSCGVTLERDPLYNNDFKLIAARTRGVVEHKTDEKGAARRRFQDATPKLMRLLPPFLEKLNNKVNDEVNITKDIKLKDVNKLIIRGEVVLKVAVDSNNEKIKAPASFVSGKFNGGDEVWNEALQYITFKPFEIVEVFTDKRVIIPTQYEANMFFHNIIGYNPFVYAKVIDEDVDKQLVYISKLYTAFCSKLKCPIDGVVYCAIDWQYPFDKDNNSTLNYNKWAWKPESSFVARVTGIEMIHDKNGSVKFTVYHEASSIHDGREMRKLTAYPKTLYNFRDSFGIGSSIYVVMHSGMGPVIENCMRGTDKDFQLFTFPTVCDACGSRLNININEAKKKYEIKCNNDHCIATLSYAYEGFFKDPAIKLLGIGRAGILKALDKDHLEPSLYNLVNSTSFAKNKQALKSKLKALTVGNYINLCFYNFTGPAQRKKLYKELGVEAMIINPLISHKALVISYMQDDTKPFFVRDLSRVIYELVMK